MNAAKNANTVSLGAILSILGIFVSMLLTSGTLWPSRILLAGGTILCTYGYTRIKQETVSLERVVAVLFIIINVAMLVVSSL